MTDLDLSDPIVAQLMAGDTRRPSPPALPPPSDLSGDPWRAHFLKPKGDERSDAMRSKGRDVMRSRKTLSKRFFYDVLECWKEHGEVALRRAAVMDPVAFVKIVAGLQPQKLEVADTTFENFDDEKLMGILELVEQQLLTRSDRAKVIEGVVEDEN